MTITSRRACLGATLIFCMSGAFAQTPAAWPTKPVRMMVPFPAGTVPDVMARLLGEKLAALWGQPVVIDNKAGAGGVIGLSAVKSGDKDDHALVFAPASVYALSPYMFKSKHVDIVQDFLPVGLVGVGPMMVAVRADSPAHTLTDLIAMARKEPDKFVVATTPPYSLPHLTAELIGRAAGVPLRAVPYGNTGQSIAAVINGDAQMLIDGIPPIDSMIKGKRLKAVAVLSDKRLPEQPQLPTAAESYPSLVINGWFGIVAPRETKATTIERVNRDLATALAQPDLVARFEALGVYPRPLTPTQFGTFWSQERSRWEQVLRDVGAQPTVQ